MEIFILKDGTQIEGVVVHIKAWGRYNLDAFCRKYGLTYRFHNSFMCTTKDNVPIHIPNMERERRRGFIGVAQSPPQNLLDLCNDFVRLEEDYNGKFLIVFYYYDDFSPLLR